MNKLLSKILITCACSIILMHAVVPHHHHECCGETDLFFTCQHHHSHDEDHDCGSLPFDVCKLQEMLAHLIISNNDDEDAAYCFLKPVVHQLFVSAMPSQHQLMMPLLNPQWVSPVNWAEPLPTMSELESLPLRAPPLS